MTAASYSDSLPGCAFNSAKRKWQDPNIDPLGLNGFTPFKLKRGNHDLIVAMLATTAQAGSAIRTTDAAIPRTTTLEIMQRDGLPSGPHPNYEVDHRVPLCLGGSEDDSNLWAQPRRSIEPVWNADRKDELEARLCQMVCSGQLDLETAQREIAGDWQTVYRKYFQLAQSNAPKR